MGDDTRAAPLATSDLPTPLSASTLASIATRGVAVPRYDRATLRPRIAHIGVGGFHRAHLALYLDELAAGGSSDWGVRGIGLLPGDAAMATALGEQEHLYTLIERGPGAPTVRVVGSIIEYHHCAADPGAAADLLADPVTTIVSLTITEAGYGAAGGPTFDVLARALEQRRRAEIDPVTVLSCDNLPGNGDAARRCTIAASARIGDELADWVARSCAFPNSMVDRITPVTSDEDRTWLRDRVGIDDRWPVVAEPFRQWVVEDDFACGRPDWPSVGVLLSDRVHDWELYKLRILNAAHSSMAYVCALAGLTYVDEAVAHSEVSAFLEQLLTQEAAPSLREIAGHPRLDYVHTVMERFANTGTRDQIARLCIDGTAKFPTFLIPTVEFQLATGGPVAAAALALAGWGHYLATTPVSRQSFDASGDEARDHARRAQREPVAFLDFAAVFPPAVAGNQRFRAAFNDAWQRIGAAGPLAALAG